MMAFTNSPVTPPSVIDDDIQRTINNILKAANITNGSDNMDTNHSSSQQQQQQQQQQPTLFQPLCVAMQQERNRWKDKLHTTLQEIDRQHRAAIAVQASLQDLVDNFGILPLHSPKSDNSSNGRRSTDLIAGLQAYIVELRDSLLQASANSNVNNVNTNNTNTNINTNYKEEENLLEIKLKKMQSSVLQLEKEKVEQAALIRDKSKEIQWLQKELNAIRIQLHKLRRIVLNYNESHSTNFHLDVTVNDLTARSSMADGRGVGGGIHVGQGQGQGQGHPLSRERTYVEGDQMDFFATTGEEIALWKLRAKQNGGSDSRGRGTHRAGIAQCLRCQQLFKPSENNAMACRYHKKGREIREQYDNAGRLSKVMYKWACCKKGLDVQGCTHGYHI